MRWWRVRFPLAALMAVCLALIVMAPSESEGAQPRRPRVTWSHAEPTTCTRALRPDRSFRLCASLQPGDETVVFATLTVQDANVIGPRIVTQSANGATLITVEPVTPPLPDELLADEELDLKITIKASPNLRARNISGRIYLADRQAVLTAPLNLRIDILHPTAEELARTPVIVPTNHIQLVTRPPQSVQLPDSARFNVRHLIVTNLTNVTWTNRAEIQDEAPSERAVKGTLCDPTKPLSPTRKCDFDPAATARCALTVHPEDEQVITDADERVLCFLSPRLRVQGHYSLRLSRPLTRQPLTYYMEDALHDPETMVEEIGERKYYPYVTVK